jgi:hypothetical protein
VNIFTFTKKVIKETIRSGPEKLTSASHRYRDVIGRVLFSSVGVLKEQLEWLYELLSEGDSTVRCGLVVRIPGFHPGGPGSIPGTGIRFTLLISNV